MEPAGDRPDEICPRVQQIIGHRAAMEPADIGRMSG